jgi:predicted transcriptional regulator
VEYERKQKTIIAQQNEEIARLNAALEQSKTPPIQPNLPQVDPFEDRIGPDEISVLGMLERGGGQLYIDNIIDHSNLPKIKIEFAIGELQRRGLINRNYDEEGEIISFTHEGRRVLLKYMEEMVAQPAS